MYARIALLGALALAYGCSGRPAAAQSVQVLPACGTASAPVGTGGRLYTDTTGTLCTVAGSGGGGGGATGSVTSAGTNGTSAQAVQGITGGVPLPIQGGNTSAVKTDGSGTTQPVSAASLPLPTGAATSAAQTNVQSSPGTSAGTALTIQGATAGVAVPATLPKVAPGPTTARTAVATGTTATAILAAGRIDEMVSLKNSGTVRAYIGGTGVTAANGWPLAVGESMTMDAKMAEGGISAILDTGQATAGEIAVWRF
ncbi:hypothetical protein [Methylobacterium sp. Gmos1]